MDKKGILDGLDDPSVNAEVKFTGFKKKLVKGKKSARPKLSFEDPELEEDDFGIQPKVVPRNRTAVFKERSKIITPKQPLVNKQKLSRAFAVEESEDINREGESLQLEDDPENNPIIENIDELESYGGAIDKIPTVRNDAVVGSEETKEYVPIVSNNEPELKVTKKELNDEYEDGYNYDDGTTENQKPVEDEGDLEISNEDYFAEGGEPSASLSTGTMHINKDMYDLELGSDASGSDTETEAGVKTVRSVQLTETFTISEQKDSIKELIEQLYASKLENEKLLQSQRAELELVSQKKTKLLHDLMT